MNPHILPVPFLDNIPKVLREEIADGNANDGQALCDYMDTFIDECDDLVTEFGFIQTPERCPSQFLNELGYMINANIVSTDTDTQKRQKIQYAIANRQTKGSFTGFLKALIDAITGYSSSMWTDLTENWWVEMDPSDGVWSTISAGKVTTPYDWGIEGSPGGSHNGLWELATGLEVFAPGNLYINLGDGGVLGSTIINEVIALLQSYAYIAYMIINIGWVSNNLFTIYGTV